MKKITKLDERGELSIIETSETIEPRNALADAVVNDYFDPLFRNKRTREMVYNSIIRTKHGWQMWFAPDKKVKYIISELIT